MRSVNSGSICSVIREGNRAKIFYAHGPWLTMGLLFTLCGVGTRNPALCYKLGLAADTFAHLQANGGVLRAAGRVGPAKPECLQGQVGFVQAPWVFAQGFELTHLLLPLQLQATAQAPSQSSDLRTESSEGCWDLTPKDQDNIALFGLREYSIHPNLLGKKIGKKDRKKRLQNVFHFL